MFLDWIGQLWSNQSTKNSSTTSTKILFLFHNEYLAANVTRPDIHRNIMLTDKKQDMLDFILEFLLHVDPKSA